MAKARKQSSSRKSASHSASVRPRAATGTRTSKRSGPATPVRFTDIEVRDKLPAGWES